MTVDPNTLSALSQALDALNTQPAHPVPTGMIAALADIAEPGVRIKLDIAASEQLGTPLISIVESQQDAQFLAQLTKRQKQVASLILQGQSNCQIASELGISIATVKDHVHAILARFNLPSRSALIAAARSYLEI